MVTEHAQLTSAEQFADHMNLLDHARAVYLSRLHR
jgi:hypothetical protein